MNTSKKKGSVFQTWITCFVWIVLIGDLHGLITKTLNVCGDINSIISCPLNTVLIVKSVTRLNGTICKDASNCPDEETLKITLLKDCFAKQYCDMNRTTFCNSNNGELGVEAACVKDENVITNCEGRQSQLSSTSGPILMVTPGYPNQYNVPQQCSNVINLASELYNGKVSIIDRYTPAINIFLCGTLAHIDVIIKSGAGQCTDRLSLTETFPNAQSFNFTFSPFSGDVTRIRGILFQVDADTVKEDVTIVPFLLKELPKDQVETNQAAKTEDGAFFTPLVVVAVTAGSAVFVLLLILIFGVTCKCCCRDSKDKTNSKSTPKSQNKEKRKTDTTVGAEAFFAGAKAEPPYSNNKTIYSENNRQQQSVPESRNGDPHLYQNTGSVQSTMTVTADVHRERTRPRGRRKPMKLPRKSKPPPASLQPIYENQGLENGSPSTPPSGQSGYENVGYANTS